MTHHVDCKVASLVGSAWCNLNLVLVDGKQIDLVPVDHCQVRHCAVF